MLSSSIATNLKRTACILSLTALFTFGAAGAAFIGVTLGTAAGTTIGASQSLAKTVNTMQSEWNYCQEQSNNHIVRCIFSIKRSDSLLTKES